MAKRKTTLMGAALAIGAAAFTTPLGGTSTYTSVSAIPTGHLHIVREKILRSAPWIGSGPDYFVDDGELYLRNQTTHGTLILLTYIRPGIDDTTDIVAFRSQHPELERYWPEPDRPDGGVAWARENIINRLEEDINSMTSTP